MLLETAVTVSAWDWLAAPELIPVRFTVCSPAFSLIVRLEIAFNVGGWLTALTVTVNVCVTMLLLAPPSLTVTVMVAEPLAFATGVKVSVPFVPGLV